MKNPDSSMLASNSDAVSKLIVILKRAGYLPWQECKRVEESYTSSIRSSLIRRTDLSLPRGCKVKVEISPYVPNDIIQILNEIDPIYLWLIARERDMSRALPLLTEMLEMEPELSRLVRASDYEGAPEITANLMRDLLDELSEFIAKILRLIFLSYRGDTLGQYDPRSKKIKLNWVVIFLASRGLGVSVISLAFVVLTHELAHLVTHIGEDTDEDSWDMNHFYDLDPRICEGLAQFYTKGVCKNWAERSDWRWMSDNPVSVFYKLLENQDEPYLVFENWASGHRKQGEVIRQTMIKFRSVENNFDPKSYHQFLEVMNENERQY